MPKYQYNGEVERSFPTLGITVKKGDVFDAPEGLRAPGLSIAETAKTAPAASAPKEKEKEKAKEETKPSASSDTNAGA